MSGERGFWGWAEKHWFLTFLLGTSSLSILSALVLRMGRAPAEALPAPAPVTPVGPNPIPPLPPGNVPSQWAEVTGEEIVVSNGLRVLALVELPFYVPNSSATPEAVRAYAEKRGWTNVQSQRIESDDADLLVMATWGRSFGVVEKPGAVVKAWRDLAPPPLSV